MHVSRATGAMIKIPKTLTEGEFFSTVVIPREDDFVEGKMLGTHTGSKNGRKKFPKHTHSSIWFEGGHQNYFQV